ncbi:hypothetical protein L7F22_036447 [Adiantum nelumboides]|nr:hypothetical protein [Adiantum nelumboides]
MGFITNIQHLAASIYYTQVSQSSLPPFLTAYRSFLERRNYGVFCNVTATTHSQGGADADKLTFKKPKWLLPAQEEGNNVAKDELPNKSLFQVILTTSRDCGSSISDLNAGILLAFIGEDGRGFLYRLSNLVSPDMYETTEQHMELCESKYAHYRFQRGARDVVTIVGPDVGKLEAVWVAPEQGTWRVQSMTVRVFPENLNRDHRADTEKTLGKILQYNFSCEETLIGDGGVISAAELRVSSVSEVSNKEFLHVDLSKHVGGSQTSLGQVREQGLKEYEALKLSLLSYDALLVVAGSAIAAVVGYKDISEGYLIGGVFGFFYLFLLERAVDELSARSYSPPSLKGGNLSLTSERETTMGKNSDALNTTGADNLQPTKIPNSFRTPLTRLSGIFVFCVLIVKVGARLDVLLGVVMRSNSDKIALGFWYCRLSSRIVLRRCCIRHGLVYSMTRMKIEAHAVANDHRPKQRRQQGDRDVGHVTEASVMVSIRA